MYSVELNDSVEVSEYVIGGRESNIGGRGSYEGGKLLSNEKRGNGGISEKGANVLITSEELGEASSMKDVNAVVWVLASASSMEDVTVVVLVLASASRVDREELSEPSSSEHVTVVVSSMEYVTVVVLVLASASKVEEVMRAIYDEMIWVESEEITSLM